MADGFLGYPASTFMLDVVVCALLLVVPTLVYSLYLAKFRRSFVWHRNIQVTLGIVLLITVALFEIDIQMHGRWENIVNRPEGRLSAEQFGLIRQILYVHLVFAISTPFLWGTTLFLALRRFGNPPQPGQHSSLHKTLGWLSALDITLTSVTGLVFYYYAFMV